MTGHAEYSKVGPYILLETLGSGSFGKVKLAVHEITHKRYACKILDKSLVRQRVLNKQVKKEISIMQTLNHRNTVSVVSVLSTHSKVFLVMELVSGGELFDEILRHRRLSEPYARFYFRQLIDGLQHCHEHGVYHRDLKPENLLLDENKTLKITDFGLSTLCSEPGSLTGSLLLHTRCGTPNYVAPEMIIDEPIGYSGAKVDVWSCGIILFVLIAGALPFDADDTDDLFARILRRDIKYPPWFSSSLKDLIGNILADPEKRYSLADIRRHPWFNGHVETSMEGESLEPTLAATDFRAAFPPVPGDGGVTQSPNMTHNNRNDNAHAPGSTQPGQASLLSQYVHMPGSGEGQLAAPGMNRRIDSLDFGIRAESEDGNFGNHSESGMHHTDEAPILPAAISENSLPHDRSLRAPSNAELSPPLNPPDGGKSHIERFRNRVLGPEAGSSVQSSDDDHEYEFEDAQEVGAAHRLVGNSVHAMKGKASQIYGSESRRRGYSWNQDFHQSPTSHSATRESDGLLSRSSDGDPGIRRFVQRELWNHDANSWRESTRAFGEFGDTTWDCENGGFSPDDEVGQPFSTDGYGHQNGPPIANRDEQEDGAKAGGKSAEVSATSATPIETITFEADFVTRTSKLVRAISHDGIALSAKTRRRPRPQLEVDASKATPALTFVQRVSDHPCAQRLQSSDETRDSNSQHPQTKKILRNPSQQRPQKRERTRRNTVRFDDIERLQDRRGCESDRDWVESDVGKMLWCRMMKDYDMIPDADEFDMDSLALNELWTSGLQRESIGRSGSFAAQRFGSRRLTVTRSTQYLASQVPRSEVERWGSLAAGKTVNGSEPKGQKGSKGPHGVVFRDPSPSSAVASNSSSPTSVREDSEARSGVSRALSYPLVPVGAVNNAAEASRESRGMRRHTETSISAPSRTTLSGGADGQLLTARNKDSSSSQDTKLDLVSKPCEQGRETSASPRQTAHEDDIAGTCEKLSSIPLHMLKKSESLRTVTSSQGSRGIVSSRLRERTFSGSDGAESYADGVTCLTGVGSTSSIDITDEISGTKVRLGGNRDLLQSDGDSNVDESDDDEYQSDGADGTIGAEPPPGLRRFDSQGVVGRRNSKRDIATQSTESGTASSSDAFRNTNCLHMDGGQFSNKKGLTRAPGDNFSTQSSDSGFVTSGVTKLKRQAGMVSGRVGDEDAKGINRSEGGGYQSYEVDEVVASVTNGIPRSRSSPWNVGGREDADSLESGGGVSRSSAGAASRSSGGGAQPRSMSRSVPRGDMNVVSPFSMEIPGPRRRLGSYGGVSGVGVLLPRVGSARRFFEKQPPPMYGSKVTLFHSALKPGPCYMLVRELLQEYGCTMQGPSAPRGRKRFTLKCEVKKDEVNIGAVIKICGYDDVLSSVTFKKKAGCDSEAFERFYTSIHEMYRARSRRTEGSSSVGDSASASERKTEGRERRG